MKPALKWGAIIVGGLLVVFAAAILLIPMFVDAGKFKPLIEKRISEATGRAVSVGEDLRLSLFPRVGIASSDLRLGNPPGFEEKEFVTVKSFDVRVKLFPLLRKDIQVQRFILNEPRIVLVRSKDGTGNWEMPQKPDETRPKEKPTEKGGVELPIKALAVNDFAIKNGTVIWTDHKTGLQKEAADVNLRLKDLSLDQPIGIAFSGRLDGKPLSLNGKVGPIGRQIGQGTIYLDIVLTALEEFKCKLKGQVENALSAPRVDLAVDLDEFSPRKLLAAFGQSFPVATADPKAIDRLALVAKIKADKDGLNVSDGKLKLDDSVLNLTAKAADFSKPDVSFNITLDQINVDRYMPPKGDTNQEQDKKSTKTAVPPAGKTAPKTEAKPFNFAAVSVDGRLKAGKVTLNKRDIQDIQLVVQGKNGPIKLSLSARLKEGPVLVEGTVGPFGPKPGEGVVPLDLTVNAVNELKLKASGKVINPTVRPGVDIALKVDEFSPRKLLAAFGQPFPLATSDPNAINRVAFSAKLKAQPTGVSISDGKMTLDDSALNITFRVPEFSKPDIFFDISLDQINLDRYLPPMEASKPGESKSPEKGRGVTPKAEANPFDLTAVALDGRLKAGKVTLNKRDIQDIQLVVQGKNGPIKLSLSARIKEGPVSVEGTVGPFGPKPGEGDVPLDLTVNAVNELKLKASGKVINPATQPVADVALRVDDFSPRKLLAAFGQPFPLATSDPKAVNRVAFSGRIKAGPTSVSVSGGKMTLDESRLNLAFRAADFTRPDVGFDMTVDQINLDRYLPSPKGEMGGKQTAHGGKPSKKTEAAQPASGREATAYGPLRRLLIDGQLKAGRLTVNNMKLQDVLLKISGKNGVINLDPIKTNLYQGSFSGKGNLNVQEATPKTGLNLNLTNVQVGPLLKDAAQKDFLEGTANAQMDLTMSGDTAETIKRTLNGKGQLKFNDGAVKGFDLAAMARNVKAAFGLEAEGTARPRTDFTELDVPFTMTSGVAEIPKAMMKGPFIRLEASGRANLPEETLDLRVEPKAVATIKGQGDEAERSGILVPVLVTGSFNSPKFQPDLKSIIKQQVDKGVLESEPVKKILEKEEMKKFEEPAKGLLKDFLKKP
jgi:AsmA protein